MDNSTLAALLEREAAGTDDPRRLAAVRLREQDAEIALLKARIDHDREVIHGYSVRVDKLDRIEAASGDDVEWSVALAVCRELAVRYPSWASDLGITEALLRRLADALDEGDQ